MTACPCHRPLPKFGICDVTHHACECGREHTLRGATVMVETPRWVTRVEALEKKVATLMGERS